MPQSTSIWKKELHLRRRPHKSRVKGESTASEPEPLTELPAAPDPIRPALTPDLAPLPVHLTGEARYQSGQAEAEFEQRSSLLREMHRGFRRGFGETAHKSEPTNAVKPVSHEPSDDDNVPQTSAGRAPSALPDDEIESHGHIVSAPTIDADQRIAQQQVAIRTAEAKKTPLLKREIQFRRQPREVPWRESQAEIEVPDYRDDVGASAVTEPGPDPSPESKARAEPVAEAQSLLKREIHLPRLRRAGSPHRAADPRADQHVDEAPFITVLPSSVSEPDLEKGLGPMHDPEPMTVEEIEHTFSLDDPELEPVSLPEPELASDAVREHDPLDRVAEHDLGALALPTTAIHEIELPRPLGVDPGWNDAPTDPVHGDELPEWGPRASWSSLVTSGAAEGQSDEEAEGGVPFITDAPTESIVGVNAALDSAEDANVVPGRPLEPVVVTDSSSVSSVSSDADPGASTDALGAAVANHESLVAQGSELPEIAPLAVESHTADAEESSMADDEEPEVPELDAQLPWPKKPLLKRELRFRRPAPHPGRISTDVVGLRIGSTQLAAARVRTVGDRHEVVQVARRPLESGIVVAGEVREPEALSSALKSFFDSHRLPRKAVRLGVASNRIGVRVLEVPVAGDPALFENVVRFHAQEVLPIPLAEAALDQVMLGEIDSLQGPLRRILVAFAHRDLVNRYADACKRAHIKLVGIDFDAFALLRALDRQHGDGVRSDRATVAVSIGHERTIFAVAEGEICDFTRVLEWGGSSLNVSLARALNLAPSETVEIKHQLGLDGATAPEGLSEEQAGAAQRALRNELEVLARELLASLQFYQSRAGSLAIGEILLAGGGAQLSGIVPELERLIGVPVRVGDPFGRVELGKKVDWPADVGSLPIAVGLGIAA